MADQTKMSKEELTDFIARLYTKRKNLNKKLTQSTEMLKERKAEMPAFQEVEEAEGKLAMARAKLNDQLDKDDRFLGLVSKRRDAQDELNDTEASLSSALTTYMVEHKARTVHVDPNESESIDRQINVSATIGKKVAVQLDLFEEAEQPEQPASPLPNPVDNAAIEAAFGGVTGAKA